MRLGSLAKDLNKKFPELEAVLIEEFSIENDKGPNFKLEENHIQFLMEKFPKPVVEEVIEQVVETPIEKTETVDSSEEVEVEIYEVDAKDEDTVPEKIDLKQFESKKEEAKPSPVKREVFHNIVPEEPIDYKPQTEEEEEAIKELESRTDENGVIRAPEVEPLKGITVQGKIEIPKPLTPEEKEAKRLAKLIEEGKVELDENGEPINYYKPKTKTKEEREEAKRKRKEKKLQNELKAIERKRKNEEKAKKRRDKAKAEKEKEARKAYYEEKMQKQRDEKVKTHVHANVATATKKKKKKKAHVQDTPSTGWFGWFWRLLDPK